MLLWLAKDKSGYTVWLYKNKPIRDSVNNCWLPQTLADMSGCVEQELFPELKWEDDPIEVELIIQPRT